MIVLGIWFLFSVPLAIAVGSFISAGSGDD